jgi:hypothetical protein
VLADIERSLSQSTSSVKRGSQRRIEESGGGGGEYYNHMHQTDGLPTDASNRSNTAGSAAGRQSRSANAAARSLTRRNQ